MKNVVFIGADPKVVQFAELSVRLRWPDATITVATTAAAGLAAVNETSPEVVLLHPDFSDMSLSQAIEELRRFFHGPLLVLGRGGDEMEVVTALETGADNYVRLPCDLAVLMALVWALLRREGLRPSQEPKSILRSGRLLINPTTSEVFLNEKQIILTSTEFRLLHLLARNQGRVVQHQALEQAILGKQADTSGLVKKYVQHLRRKLGDNVRMPRWIASVHGVGYRFIGPAPDISNPAAAMAATV